MQIAADRRALHQIPELGYDLPKTTAYLTGALKKLRCQLLFPVKGAVCAWFDFGKEDAIAFRADIDALPIPEKTALPFASQHPGQMHACGHDGHAATLLELARRLDQKTELPRNVLLVFQPAEESSGGAKPICDTGIFEKYNVKAIFGLHLWPGLPAGCIASCIGAMMSLSSELTVTVTGRSSHISKPSEGLDSLAAGMEFYRRARALEAQICRDDFCLLNFGKMESGNVRNAISDHTRLEGTLRTFSNPLFESLRQTLLDMGQEIAQQTGCGISMEFADIYPAVCNPENLFRRVAELVDITVLRTPSLGGEDFSFYQQVMPGMFFFLGIGDTPAIHSDTFNFDEQILLKGADLFETLAEKFL